jgi:hypothetical protein
MATRVVNIRTAPCDVYIGRPGPFGNPYVIGSDGDRDEVIRKFRMYFYQRLKIDPEFKTKVEALRGRTLGCYCAPLSCHGDVILEWVETSLMKDVT